MIQTTLSILVALIVLIVVHEYGHYRMAIACNVKVLRFSFGFGRVLWRRQAHPGATEFVFSALPFGGYVAMLGDGGGTVAPADAAHTLEARPLWQRALVVAAGPAANLLLAIALYAGAQWIGTQEAAALLGTPPAASLMADAGIGAGDRVQAVAFDDDADWRPVRSIDDLFLALTQGVLDHQPLRLQVQRPGAVSTREVRLRLDQLATRDMDAATLSRIGVGVLSPPVLGAPLAAGPAAQAGLHAGDIVQRVDGQAITDAQALRALIRQNVRAGQAAPMQWEVLRAGAPLALVVQPRVLEEGGARIGRVDVAIGGNYEMVTVRDGPLDALREGAHRTWSTATMSLRMLGRMLIGQASLKNLSGPLTIADVAGKSAHLGLSYYLAFLATVSVSLGVLNLLPLPILDGGRLMYYLFEGVTGRPVSELWLTWLQRGGLLILLLLMSLALSNDVARLLGLQ